jgi:hypothetical protein
MMLVQDMTKEEEECLELGRVMVKLLLRGLGNVR